MGINRVLVIGTGSNAHFLSRPAGVGTQRTSCWLASVHDPGSASIAMPPKLGKHTKRILINLPNGRLIMEVLTLAANQTFKRMG